MIGLAVGFVALQVWIAIAALSTEVTGASAAWIRVALFAVLLVETVALWRLIRAGRSAAGYAVAFGSVVVVAVLAAPLILRW